MESEIETGMKSLYINKSDGLTSASQISNDDEDTQLPTNIIVTGLDASFFDDENSKAEFELIFRDYGESATFHYFKSFKRVRVTYDNHGSAFHARLNGHELRFRDMVVNCYFGMAQVKLSKSSSTEKSDGFLHPPTPEKQFLISPPASPPVDWEPRPEGVPNINIDLINALAQLNPDVPHEVHKPISASHPSIVLHIAAMDMDTKNHGTQKIQQTKRPAIN